jgi:hypothetical protein
MQRWKLAENTAWVVAIASAVLSAYLFLSISPIPHPVVQKYSGYVTVASYGILCDLKNSTLNVTYNYTDNTTIISGAMEKRFHAAHDSANMSFTTFFLLWELADEYAVNTAEDVTLVSNGIVKRWNYSRLYPPGNVALGHPHITGSFCFTNTAVEEFCFRFTWNTTLSFVNVNPLLAHYMVNFSVTLTYPDYVVVPIPESVRYSFFTIPIIGIAAIVFGRFCALHSVATETEEQNLSESSEDLSEKVRVPFWHILSSRVRKKHVSHKSSESENDIEESS